MNTHTIITDIHQNMLKNREDTDRLVSEARVLHPHGINTDNRTGSGQVSDIDYC